MNNLERQIRKEYRKNAALISAEKSYKRYMQKVKEETQKEYDEYINADSEHKKEMKQRYIDAVKKLTVYSKEYKKVVDKVTSALAKANQKALDIVNDQMIEIYVDNYNQVAVDCKRVGITVND